MLLSVFSLYSITIIMTIGTIKYKESVAAEIIPESLTNNVTRHPTIMDKNPL